MTLLKWQNDNKMTPSFNTFFKDWFDDSYFDKVAVGTSIPAVNIKDNEKDFTVSIAAPGLKKEDFKIALNHNVLTISSEQKSEKEEKEEGKFTRREYSYSSFSRSFTIPDTVETDQIDAKYENGELKILLPKKEKAVKVTKEIAIN